MHNQLLGITPKGKSGLTLSELANLVSAAYAQGWRDEDLVKVSIDFRAGIKKAWLHDHEKPYSVFQTPPTQ